MESLPKKDDLELRAPMYQIEELRQPIERLLFTLREKIERGDFRVLIGDDASGRIPTLIFHKTLKEIYKEKGLESPKVFFFAGSGAGFSANKPTPEDAIAKSELIGEYLEHKNIRELLGESGEVLIITDTIATGNSLIPLTQALRHAGVRYEIATIGLLSEDDSDKVRMEGRLGSEIFSGTDWTPSIYTESRISGVRKNPGDVFSTPIGEKNLDSHVAEARVDIERLGSDLAERFPQENQR